MEIAGYGQLFQYLFKYIHKGKVCRQLIISSTQHVVMIGPDRAKFRIHSGDGTNVSNEPIDEIEEYWSGRYLAATEAVWRILGYNITQKSPSVVAHGNILIRKHW